MGRDDSITSKQLVYIIIGSQLGMGVLSLPRLLSESARQDAWIAALLGGLTPLLSLIIIERLGRRMPESSFVAMNHRLFGPWLGSFMVFLFIVYIIFFEATVIRMFTGISATWLLPRTPIPVVALVIMLVVAYAVNKGPRVVGRVNEALFWMVFPLLFLVAFPLVNADYTNFLPVGEAGFKGLAQGAFAASTAYAGTEVLLVFYFLVREKGEVLKAGIIGLGFTALVYLLVTVVCLAVWGSGPMQMLNWPTLSVLKTVQYPLLERPEIIIMALWMAVGIRPPVNLGLAAAYSLSEVLRIPRDRYFHLAVTAIALPIYIVALLPANLLTAFKWTEYAGHTFPWAGVFYPMLMLVMAVIRGKGAQDA